MPADPFAAAVEEFKRQITFRPEGRVYLGDPPMLDGRGACTFCGGTLALHATGATAVFSYNASRTLREYHRGDFGSNGFYSDEDTR